MGNRFREYYWNWMGCI